MSELKDVTAKVENGLKQLQGQLGKVMQAAKSGSGVHVEAGARDIAFSIARIYIGKLLFTKKVRMRIKCAGALLAEQAADSKLPTDLQVAIRFCESPLVQLEFDSFTQHKIDKDNQIVFENYAGRKSSKI